MNAPMNAEPIVVKPGSGSNGTVELQTQPPPPPIALKVEVKPSAAAKSVSTNAGRGGLAYLAVFVASILGSGVVAATVVKLVDVPAAKNHAVKGTNDGQAASIKKEAAASSSNKAAAYDGVDRYLVDDLVPKMNRNFADADSRIEVLEKRVFVMQIVGGMTVIALMLLMILRIQWFGRPAQASSASRGPETPKS